MTAGRSAGAGCAVKGNDPWLAHDRVCCTRLRIVRWWGGFLLVGWAKWLVTVRARLGLH
jgi:hypothetical protein